MGPDARDLEQLLFDNAPLELFERVLRALFAAHRLAHEETVPFYESTELTNLQPYVRRAKVESFIREAAAMVPGVTSRVARSSSWNHTEILSGRVIITAHAVPSPCAMVEPADFRVTLAQSSQDVLWHLPQDEPAQDTPLYCVLLHSTSSWVTKDDQERFGHLPGSVYLAIPAPDLKYYVREINLFDRFPQVVESNIPRDWNEEAKVSYVTRARKLLAS